MRIAKKRGLIWTMERRELVIREGATDGKIRRRRCRYRSSARRIEGARVRPVIHAASSRGRRCKMMTHRTLERRGERTRGGMRSQRRHVVDDVATSRFRRGVRQPSVDSIILGSSSSRSGDGGRKCRGKAEGSCVREASLIVMSTMRWKRFEWRRKTRRTTRRRS